MFVVNRRVSFEITFSFSDRFYIEVVFKSASDVESFSKTSLIYAQLPCSQQYLESVLYIYSQHFAS